MCFLFKSCVLFVVIVIAECTMGGQQGQQCLSSDNGNVDECREDWKQMSAFVASLVDAGRSTAPAVDDKDKVDTKTNALTLLIRAASGVIGRSAEALKSLIVSGLMLLTRTILKVSEYERPTATVHDSKFVPGGRPIDWILNNSYIKSMIGHAIDGTLTDRLDRLASGMPCVQLLVCRLSPIVSDMQRRVREDVTRPRRRDDSDAEAPWWNVSDWRRVGETARLCAAKHRDCTAKTAVIRPAVVRD